MPAVKCRRCGKRFHRPKSWIRPSGTFCSRKCYWGNAKIEQPCKGCGVTVRSWRHRPRIYCSRACFVASKSKVGVRSSPRMKLVIDAGYLRGRSRVARNGCWLWPGPKTKYGQIRAYRPDGTTWWPLAHRAAYEVFKGPIPKGIVVRHRCHTPACINPDHLVLGTPAQNTADSVARRLAEHVGTPIAPMSARGSL